MIVVGSVNMRMYYKYFVFLAALLLLALGMSIAFDTSAHGEKSAVLLHTTVSLKAEGTNADTVINESMKHIQYIEIMLDDRQLGDLASINHAAPGEYVSVQPDLWHLLAVADKYSRLTNGSFSVAIGSLVDLWGIGKENAKVPDENEIANACALADYRHVYLRASDHSVMLDQAGVKIHLGGAGKGFAADEVRKIFARHGVRNGLINLGTSSMYAIGKNNSGQAWQIGIKNPRQQTGYFAIVELSDAALSTSAADGQYFDMGGRHYGHIFDPLNGMPVENNLMSVTVIVEGSEDDCALTADILSTALFVMGEEKGVELINSLSSAISAIIVDKNGRITTVHGAEKRLKIVDEKFTLK